MTSKVLLLVSSLGSDSVQEQDQRRAESLLAAKNVEYTTLDGADPVNKDRRNQLFALSGQRGKYPQFFMEDASGNMTFLGLWEQIERMNECSQLPANILAENPNIETFDRVFKNVARKSPRR